jgi:WD40 repeat protein
MTRVEQDGSARLWSVEPENGLAFRVLANDHVRDVALADQPRGNGGAGALLMATAGYDGQIDVWRYVQGKPLEPPVRYLRLEGHTDRIRQIAFAPSGRSLASAGADGTARIWDLASGEGCRWEVAAKPDVCASPGFADCPDVYQVRFAPDERWLVTASSDPVQPVRIWNPIGCKALPPPSLGAVKGGVRSLALTRGDAGALVLATGGNDGAIHVLRQDPAGTWSQLCAVEAHEGSIGAVTFSPDGRWLAAAGRDGRASLIELQGNRCGAPRYLDGDAGSLYDVQFAPDSKTLVTAAFDAKAQVWSVDGTLVAQLSAQQNRISSAGFSPDGEWIVTASRDGTIALWRRPTRVIARSPTPYLILDGDLGAVTQAVFDPKGQMIGAGYWDEAAVLWRLWSPDPNPPESLVAHWGKERARLALIGEASRYLQELGGLSPGAPVGREARGGDKTSAGSQ